MNSTNEAGHVMNKESIKVKHTNEFLLHGDLVRIVLNSGRLNDLLHINH